MQQLMLFNSMNDRSVTHILFLDQIRAFIYDLMELAGEAILMELSFFCFFQLLGFIL